MKVFLDANVILDYLTDRQPFADDVDRPDRTAWRRT